MQMLKLTHMFFPHYDLPFLPFLVIFFHFLWRNHLPGLLWFSFSLTIMFLLTRSFKESHIKCIVR